ncbi:hypothetical protein B1748_04970 [Paenibacillus sp. MY03]|uniref:ABC transporter substrate-binding protein n=1 Tax=Paenibacillus sp. MY03 TaxID=302980 RepID=UPI000B3C3C1D|nr:extracellular solute-binding protein [Paenibacillus sp. MY03]OUS78116.1 hypothetical protein B1748_04970 [Paenibacillus sp. MY03]
MRKMKTISIIGLIAAMLISLAACTGGSNNKPPTATSQPETESNSPSPEPEEQPTINMNGETLRFAAWGDLSPKADSVMGELLIAKQKEVEQKYNVKIEYVDIPYNELKDKITTSILSGEPFADIIRLEYKWVFPSMVQNGQILELEESDVNESKSLGELYKKMSYNGKKYMFGSDYVDGSGIYYNRTLFKKLGLLDLHEMVAAKEWTWEKMNDIAKQATQDTDGDGQNDTWGLTAYHEGFAGMLASTNGALIVDEENGREALSDPAMIETLGFLNKLYHEDKVVRFNDPADWGEQRRMFPEGNVAMVPGYSWEAGEYNKTMNDIDWGYVPLPIGPQMDDYVAPNSGLVGWFLPKGSKYPKEAFHIWNELQDIEPVEDYPNQTTFEKWFKHEEDIETAKLVSGKFVVQNYGAYPDFPFWGLVDDIIKNRTSVSTAVEKVKQQAQASIDAVINK